LKLSYLRYVIEKKSRAKVQKDKDTKPALEELRALNLGVRLKVAFEQAVGAS
jgi:hypothetical protein